MNDLFAPCCFTNIPHDMSEGAINNLPSFLGKTQSPLKIISGSLLVVWKQFVALLEIILRGGVN